MVEVWARRENSQLAADFVAQLREVGQHARENNSQWFDQMQIDLGVAVVYHDGTDPVIPYVYGEAGIEVRLLPGCEERHVTGEAALAEDEAARVAYLASGGSSSSATTVLAPDPDGAAAAEAAEA